MSSEPPSPPLSPSDHAKLVLKNLQRGTHKKELNSMLQDYINYAWWIPLGVDLFIDLGSVVYAGLQPDAKTSNDDLLNQFDMLIYSKPKSQDVLDYLHHDSSQK
ncbi:hypothetical protein H0H87_008540, partial [Tephrocybe sp. NHM501043]